MQSNLTILDNSSKGTFLDGRQVDKGNETKLTGKRHELKLGNWGQKLM